MDVIYPYKAAPFDFELRFSLRSLSNVAHDRVIIAGDRPRIVSEDVSHVQTGRARDRYQSSTANIRAACDVSEAAKVVVMHDDIFLLEPWEFRHENRGTIEEYLSFGGSFGAYRAAVERTRDILVSLGVSEPLFFGLHTPTVYNRLSLAGLIDEYSGHSVLLRTLYHNLNPQPSKQVPDVKQYGWTGPADVPVLSISDHAAADPAFRRWISTRFPDRGPYEISGDCLILGCGPTVWDDLKERWRKFDAVIALPEAVEHWSGPLLAVASDEDHAAFLAQTYGFDAPTWCGRG